MYYVKSAYVGIGVDVCCAEHADCNPVRRKVNKFSEIIKKYLAIVVNRV